jgi:hypothetical protein
VVFSTIIFLLLGTQALSALHLALTLTKEEKDA